MDLFKAEYMGSRIGGKGTIAARNFLALLEQLNTASVPGRAHLGRNMVSQGRV